MRHSFAQNVSTAPRAKRPDVTVNYTMTKMMGVEGSIRKPALSVLALFLILCLCDQVIRNTAANQSQSDTPRPANCEDVLLRLDQAISKVREVKDNSYLIVIGRLGTGEKEPSLNRTRLKAIEKYLQRFSDVKYVTAEGDRTKSFAQVEIYVRGSLVHVIYVRRNAKYFCPEPVG